MSGSAHSERRAQKRCIPNIVNLWLDQFGDEDYDGHGGVRLYFSRKSVRQMERTLGRRFVRQNAKYLVAYRVDSARDGSTITTGWRSRHLRRK